MANGHPTLEEKVAQLTAELNDVKTKVEQLYSILDQATPRRTPAQHHAPAVSPATSPHDEPELPANISEEMLTWAGKTSLLQRLSTLCFLLVIALALRTITDNGIIPTLYGSALGMGYAATIILLGWHRYGKKSPLAPVFAACGALLMGLIVVETHSRFASLPLVPAYLTLMVTGGAMSYISYRFGVFLPIAVGTLAICLAGAAIDYPHPYFPYLAMVLITANLFGYGAGQLKSCSWLRWILLLVTMLMLQLWSIRLGMTLLRHEQPSADLAAAWFLPVLIAIALTYPAIALLEMARCKAKLTLFASALPTISAAWSMSAALYVVTAGGEGGRILGMVGLDAAVAHLGVACWLAGRSPTGTGGATSFVFAGSVLMAFALPLATGSFLLSLPVMATAAFFLAILSRHWQNGGIRATTYLMQLYACTGIAALMAGASGTQDVINVLPAGLLSVIQMFHYQWCRRWAPPSASTLFGKFDPRDRSAVVMLLTSLFCGYLMARGMAYEALRLSPLELANTFRCAQSAIINGAAVTLMLVAYLRGDSELRNVALLVTVIGAVKVLLYDLLGAHGVPLVVSVFSFGMAAAVESVLLGRWQHSPAGSKVDTVSSGSDAREENVRETRRQDGGASL
jgi:hypothetical protein